jgi:hypothetical protein
MLEMTQTLDVVGGGRKLIVLATDGLGKGSSFLLALAIWPWGLLH